MLVALRSVSKVFGERRVVDAIDLDVRPGICFGLLGPNGAGKTTTLRMIYGVTAPSSGSVRVFDLDVRTDARAVRTRLGVTLQQNVFIDALSPVDNLRVFGRYHLLSEAEITRRIEGLLDFLDLRSHAKLPVRALSGGFQRRLAIAMSLMNDPDLLILDEPTTGLDPAVRMALWGRIRELRSRGKTVLLTTHYMDEAQRLCDEIAIMALGKVIERGTPEELIHRNVASCAIELTCAPDEESTLLVGEARQARRLRSGNRLIIYLSEPTGFEAHLRQIDQNNHRAVVVRPSNLEDVFLALTGTTLE